MRVPLWLLDLGLRVFVKRALAQEQSPLGMRAGLDRGARRFLPQTSVATRSVTLNALGRSVPAVWADAAPKGAPVLLYLHGGAYLAGSPETHLPLAAALAERMGARACLPDYGLAPEHPFPAAIEDATAAYAALLEQGYPPERIAVAGDSAGGGLGAALLLSAARAGLPPPAALALFSPWTDMTMQSASLAANARADAMLPARRMADVLGFVLHGADATDPLASPLLGEFERPPPCLITAGTGEILLDDARGLAERLRAAGGTVTLNIERGLPHAWPVFCGRLAAADRTVEQAARFLSDALMSGAATVRDS